MRKNKTIKYQLQRELDKLKNLGYSKRTARKENDGQSPDIYNNTTAETYYKWAGRFGDWLHDRGMTHCSKAEARELAGEYVKSFERETTQSTVRAALAKVFHCTGPEICEINRRSYDDIIRGRGEPNDRNAAFERNHPEEAEILRGTGVRQSEVSQLTPAHFKEDRDGNLTVTIKGKGGLVRESRVFGDEANRLIRDRLQHSTDRDEPILQIPQHINVHGMREDYARRAYNTGRDEGRASGDDYVIRKGDHKGESFDKGLLDYVNQNLGHGSGRFDTAVHNYLIAANGK